MKRLLQIVVFLIFCSVSAQKNIAFDSLYLKEARDLFADDYGNIYLYRNKDFSFTKYDSVGRQQGKLLLTLPFKIQSVQNPLNISSFSENAQELRFFDQNLNTIQTINLHEKFGFIKKVFAEDLQEIWLLEESSKRLIQYNFRSDSILNAYTFDLDFENIRDMLVYNDRLYLLTADRFSVYNFKSEKLFEAAVESGKRLRRENAEILVLGKNFIQKFVGDSLKTVFSAENSQIVDKNSAAYFVIKDNKLYLYPVQKNSETR